MSCEPLPPHFSPLRGRGTDQNPMNRFEKIIFEPDPDEPDINTKPKTEFFHDTTKSLITYNNSPDLGFTAGINIYRGCEHGCSYCFARPYHEYLGMSSGLDFESKILIKANAPQLLAKELSARKWHPQVVVMSGATDCYQPVERRLQLNRQCLEVFAEFCNPVVIITKNHLVTRDIDVLKKLAKHQAVKVFISVTTLDAQLGGWMEPRASRPVHRLKAIRELSEAGIPVGAMVAPIIPGLTDHEIPQIVASVANHGAQSAGHTIVRLPFAVKDIFTHWLETYFPDRKDKILNRIRDIRGGKLNDPRFGMRMAGEGAYAEHIHDMFYLACKRSGLDKSRTVLSTASFKIPSRQLTLFD